MRKRILFLMAFACLFSFSVFSAHGEGLSLANYSEVFVENLQIGGVYSMTKLVNLPLEVTNQSYQPAIVRLSVYKPEKERTKKGFEPIPDPNWVKIGQPDAEIAANGTYKTDVIITIPNDKALLGKKFHVNFRAQTIPPKTGMLAFAVAVEGRMLFTVSPEVKSGVAEQNNVHLDFSLIPARIQLDEVSVGKNIEILTTGKKPVVLKNNSNEKINLVFSSIDPSKTVLTIDPDYEACPSPEYITFKKDELSLNPGESGALKMVLNIPDKPEYKGKRYEFIVTSHVGGSTLGERYLQIYVTTKK